MNNCYYLKALGSVPSGATQVSAERIASGELAYLLNGSISGGNRWYQNLDNGKTADEHPVPNNSHGAVYYGYKDCETETPTITNTVIKKTTQGHNGGEANCLSAAICADCGKDYKPLDPNTHCTTETYYAYTDEHTHEERYSCCNAVIKTEDHSGEATCTNTAYCDKCNHSYGQVKDDAHTKGQIWVDTGYGTHEHKYTCCGAVTETEAHNLTITADDEADTITVICSTCNGNSDYEWRSGNGTVTLNVSDKEYDGGVLDVKTDKTGFMDNWSKPAEISVKYCCEGGCKTAGEHTITMTVGDKTVTKTVNITKKPLSIAEVKAFSRSYDGTGEVFVNNIPLDGIVVYQKGDYSVFDIKDNVAIDLSKAVVTTKSGATGYYSKANVGNIVLIGSDKDNYTINTFAEDVKLVNTYGGNYEIYKIQVWVTPLDQTLYGDEALDQTAYTLEGLDEELYTLSGVALNEENGKITVDGEGIKITLKDSDADITEYFDITNHTANVLHYCANHTFNDNGFCATGECDSYEPATLNDNGTDDNPYDDYYEIENAGQLYWFAKQVNDYGEYDKGAKLTADIKVNDDPQATGAREWKPIGKNSSLPYSSMFDGNGHTISGLYCKNTEEEYVGLFGYFSYNYVTDLHIKNSYFEGKYSGALAGGSAGYFKRCSVGSDVTVVGTERTGGMVGSASDGSLTDCYSTANISGGVWGGLIGYSYASLKNCYTTAMQPVGSSGGSGSFTNVYYAKDTRDYSSSDGYVTQKPTFAGAVEVEDFATGEVAYKLQEGVEEIPAQGYWDDDYENWTEEVPAYIPQIWGQKIGTDKFPKFSDTKVYEDEYNNEKAYRNEINGFEILLLGADKKSATVVLDGTGKYTAVFADYDGKKLANAKTFEVEVTKPQAVRIISNESFTLGAGDKIMLWDGNMSPKCKAFEVK